MPGKIRTFGLFGTFPSLVKAAISIYVELRYDDPRSSEVVFLLNRTLVAFVEKLSSTTVDFVSSEGELKHCPLYGL